MSQTNILLESGTNELEIIEFYLDEQDGKGQDYRGHYGVNVAKVLEIINMPQVTELPDSSHGCILGAFNQRSTITPLIDLSIWLGKNRQENESPKVIITEFNKQVSSFLVSGVNRIHRLSWEKVEPPSAYVSRFSSDSITGVVKLEGRVIFILDLEKIIAELNPSTALKLKLDNEWSNTENYSALIADDSSLIRNMLKDLLEKAGFAVEAVNNGKEAWERLEELAESAIKEGKKLTDSVQVMVSDIEMPAIDGLNLTKRIKSDPRMQNLPVILFSSLISEKLRHKGEAVGADDQISKPEVGELAIRAKALIENYQG